MEQVIVTSKSNKKSKEKSAKSMTSRKCDCSDSVNLAKIFLASTVILTITGIITMSLLSLTVQNKLITTTTTTTTTTTPSDNSTGGFQIGATCMYSNQCPQYAFCEGTCKCPLHFYYNGTAGQCNIRKTYGASCSNNHECNTNVGLVCSTTCQCDSSRFWNSTYVLGGGLANGRCQNQKTHGMWYAGYSNELTYGATAGNAWTSQISRAYCNQGYWYLNLLYGTCNYIQYRAVGFPCLSHAECDQSHSMCMSSFNDKNKRCVPFPTHYEWDYRIYGIKYNLKHKIKQKENYIYCHVFRKV